MKRLTSFLLCLTMIWGMGIFTYAAETANAEKAAVKAVDSIHTYLKTSAGECLYEDKWVPMFPTGKPDNSTTWPEWNRDANFAEIVAEGYRDPGALHLRSSVYKNVGVSINPGMIPGETYTLGLWAKGTAQAQSLFSYHNGDFPIVETAEALKTTWQYYEVTFTALTSQLNLCCRDWGTNDVYVDHITLKDENGNDLLAGLGDFWRTPRDTTVDANLNFEKTSSGKVQNWQHRAVLAEGAMQSVTDRVYSGNRAIGVTRQKGKLDVSFVSSTVLIPVSPGDRIELIAHISSRNSVSGHFSVYFETFGKDGEAQPLPGMFGQERILNAGAEWSQWDTYEMTGIAGSGVYYIRIGLRIGGANADVRIDDLQYYNYTENINTVYYEDFNEPSVTTGLPGGWYAPVQNGGADYNGAVQFSGSGENRLYTELFCLQTDWVYTLHTAAKITDGAAGVIRLEGVNWKGETTDVTEIPLTNGDISHPFTAKSSVFYRLWIEKTGSGTVEIEDVAIRRNGKAAESTAHSFQSVGFRFPIGTVTAGKQIRVTGNLKISSAMPCEDSLQVQFVSSGEKICVGKLCLTEGKTMDQWPIDTNFQADFSLEIPDILPAGNYTVVLSSTGGTVGLIKVTRENQPVTTTSWVESVNGRPTLFVNNEPQVPLWFARPENPDLYEAHTVTKYAEAGIDTVVTYIFLNNNYGDVWTPEGFVTPAVDDMIWATLSGNPDAKLIVALDVNAPKWWLDANPGELAALESTALQRTGASFASEKWKQESGEIMVEAIEYLMTQPYANNIVGFKVTGGYTLEWNWWGLSGAYDVGDFSACGIRAFRQWLAKKYGTDAALQQAYSDKNITLQTAMPPTAALRREQSDSSVLTVQDHPEMLDYELFMAELKADTIEYFAALAKAAVNDRLVVGTYGGYFYMGGGYEFSSAVSNVYFDRILTSDNIDFIKSPWVYGMREIGDTTEFMGPVDSAALHGKLWIAEEDSRLNLQEMREKQDDKAAVGWTRDYRQSVEQLKRNFSYALTKGAGISFYNLMWNHTDDDQYYGAIGQMYREMEETLSCREASASDIAVFVDGQSNMLIPFEEESLNSVLYSSVFREQLKELGHSGASYDAYLLDDLLNGLVPEHKINIFLGTTWITQAERQAIQTQLQKNGNILVWIFTDGISDGTVTDIRLMEELTGMDLSIISIQRRKTGVAVLKNTNHWLTAGLQAGNGYGVETYDKMSPVIAVNASSATVLAHHLAGDDGVTSNHGALAVKDMGDWISVYSAVPNLPQGIIRNMLSYTGSHIYTDSGSDVIYASSDHIALHSVFAGTRSIRIPEGYLVYDVFRGEEVPVEDGQIFANLNAAETRLYRLTKNTHQEKMWLDDSLMTGAYTAYPGKWVPMYPTGAPVAGSTWPVWEYSSHYGKIVDEGCKELGSLYLKSTMYKNTGVAIDAGMTPGQTYTLGLWAKGTSNAGRVLALYANGDPVVIATDQELKTEWNYYEITFTAGIRQLNLVASDWGNTEIYLDNITLRDSSGNDLLAGYGDFWQREHTWQAASCTQPKTCLGCGATEGATLDHSYQSAVTAPTLISDGYTTHTCTLCGHTYTDGYTEKLVSVKGWNLTLGGDLTVNFKVYLHPEIRDRVSLQVSVAEKIWTDVTVDNDGNYCISASVAAAQMNDRMLVQVVTDEGVISLGEYTVLQYANTLLADKNMGEYHRLVNAMLCYGGAAQVYFDYQADSLVSDGIVPENAEEIPVNFESKINISGKAEGMAFYGATLLFRNQLALRFYFTYTGEGKDYSFSDGLQAVERDGMCYVELPGINPQDLDRYFTVTVNGTLSVTYSPMQYVARMSQKGSENLRALLQALYQYHLAAKSYVNG